MERDTFKSLSSLGGSQAQDGVYDIILEDCIVQGYDFRSLHEIAGACYDTVTRHRKEIFSSSVQH
jgi:hypothetical protein